MKIFNYFAFTQNKRNKAEEPKDNLTWLKHGISEFIGTILLSLALAGLSTVVAGSNHTVEAFMLHPILVGFYAGFIAVGFVIFVFIRWSCDLNPAVTITRIIKGSNTLRYGLFKIFIQIMSGIIAGLIIYSFGKLGNGLDLNGSLNQDAVNQAITASCAANKSLGVKELSWGASKVIGSIWIFFIEIVMTSLLIFPIFSKIIKDKYRDFAIMLIISMSVWMGILGGTASINPARGLSQQVPGLFFGAKIGNATSMPDLVSGTVSMELGTISAPFFYVLMQGVLNEYVNPLIIKIVNFKNYKSTSMITSSKHKKINNKKANK